MQKNGLSPKQPLKIDNQRHFYPIYHRGKLREASHIVVYDKFGADEFKFIGWYGLTNSPRQRPFVGHIKKLKPALAEEINDAMHEIYNMHQSIL